MNQSNGRKLWGIVLAAGEGTRARDFLKRFYGGRGIKQFCAVVGRRSMLEHTLARAERLIPRERILVVVSRDHQEEVSQQLAHWPVDNIIYQPANRDTAPGILLPLAYISHRDPLATVTVFPSDHFVVEEEQFLAAVGRAVTSENSKNVRSSSDTKQLAAVLFETGAHKNQTAPSGSSLLSKGEEYGQHR